MNGNHETAVNGKKKIAVRILIAAAAALVLALLIIALLNTGLFKKRMTANDWIQSGLIYLAASDYAPALAAFQSAAEIEPYNYYAHVGAGRAHLGLNDYTQSGEALAAAVDIDPSRPEAYLYMGDLAKRRGSASQAVQYWRRSAEADDTYVYAYHRLSEHYIDNRQFWEAVDVLRKPFDLGVNISDTSVFMLRAYHELGIAALNDGNSLEAQSLMDAALRYGRANEMTIKILLIASNRLHDYEKINFYQYSDDDEIKPAVDSLRPPAPAIFPQPGSYDTLTRFILNGRPETETRFTANGDAPGRESVLYMDEPVTLPYGETTIKAVSINECGLFSVPLEAEYTVLLRDDSEIIFVDYVFGQLIRKSIGKNASDKVYFSDIKDIELIHIAGNHIGEKNRNLTVNHEMFAGSPSGPYYSERGGILQTSDLALFPNLHTLVMELQSIRSLDGLSGCHMLKYLRMWGNELEDISGLGELNELLELDFYQNQIFDLTGLSRLRNCSKMDLGGNLIVDVSPLAGLAGLTHVWLDGNYGLEDVSPLAGMHWLQQINVQSTSVTDVSMFSPGTDVMVSEYE
ncbi:MAG: chitobiase/beta-hexosaminidase C-terminal domain-containing protein [Defluviitaleaceae bacterium]|nr:chitobiase/beta-hexosaminidase C-terminal domain-containing protein [Defluviitaleaceae bacterium]